LDWQHSAGFVGHLRIELSARFPARRYLPLAGLLMQGFHLHSRAEMDVPHHELTLTIRPTPAIATRAPPTLWTFRGGVIAGSRSPGPIALRRRRVASSRSEPGFGRPARAS